MKGLLHNYWSGLAPREQRLLKLGGPLILLLVLYLLVWEPLQEKRQTSPEATPEEISARLNRLQTLRAQLPPVQAMSERQWQALAQSQGLHQVQALKKAGEEKAREEEPEHWQIRAQAPSPRQVQSFLQAAAKQGWHWAAITLQGQPLQLQVELRPL